MEIEPFDNNELERKVQTVQLHPLQRLFWVNWKAIDLNFCPSSPLSNLHPFTFLF